ncbi:MAG: neutral zinc metallopeptidase [Sporichthyaceae bacterium]
MKRVGVAAAVVGLVVSGGGTAWANHELDQTDFAAFARVVTGDVNAYWAQWSRTHSSTYREAQLVLATDGPSEVGACGVAAGDPATDEGAISPAFYCPRDATIYLSVGWVYREIYQRFGDLAAAVVVAHEYAHHMQVVQNVEADSVTAAELQADCLAGVWTRDAADRGLLDQNDLDGAAKALYALGDYAYDNPNHHGTPVQRRHWLAVGFEAGDPTKCDAPDPRPDGGERHGYAGDLDRPRYLAGEPAHRAAGLF